MQAVRALFNSPYRLFLALSIPFGLLFLVATPPLGGGDEQHHLQRTYEVATWQFLHDAQAPAGLVRFRDDAFAQLPLRAAHTMSYADMDMWRRWNAIALDSGHKVAMPQTIFTQHYPLTYLLPALAMRIGLWLELRPLWLLYLCRMASFAGSIALMAAAIRLAPRHGYLMACVALLPTMVFLRSTLIGDGMEIGLCYIFIMLVGRALLGEGELRIRDMAWMALTGSLAAQCKSAYVLLPLIVTLIPRARFRSPAQRGWFFAASFLPGLLATVLWMLHERALHAGLHYETWGGKVYVDGQMAFILHHPFAFGLVLLRTVFLSPMIPQVLLGMLGELGWMDVYLPVAAYAVLACCIIGVISTHPGTRGYSGVEKKTYGALFALTMLLISVVLYTEWTGWMAPVIKGWMGRYLYPMLPLLFAFARVGGANTPQSGAKCGAVVAFTACFSLPLALYQLIAHYYL